MSRDRIRPIKDWQNSPTAQHRVGVTRASDEPAIDITIEPDEVDLAERNTKTIQTTPKGALAPKEAPMMQAWKNQTLVRWRLVGHKCFHWKPENNINTSLHPIYCPLRIIPQNKNYSDIANYLKNVSSNENKGTRKKKGNRKNKKAKIVHNFKGHKANQKLIDHIDDIPKRLDLTFGPGVECSIPPCFNKKQRKKYVRWFMKAILREFGMLGIGIIHNIDDMSENANCYARLFFTTNYTKANKLRVRNKKNSYTPSEFLKRIIEFDTLIVNSISRKAASNRIKKIRVPYVDDWKPSPKAETGIGILQTSNRDVIDIIVKTKETKLPDENKTHIKDKTKYILTDSQQETVLAKINENLAGCQLSNSKRWRFTVTKEKYTDSGSIHCHIGIISKNKNYKSAGNYFNYIGGRNFISCSVLRDEIKNTHKNKGAVIINHLYGYKIIQELIRHLDELCKRENARFGREVECHIPWFFNKKHRKQCVRRLMRAIEREFDLYGIAAIHNINNMAENANCHFHLFLPDRYIENGRMGGKNREINAPSLKLVERVREIYTMILNDIVSKHYPGKCFYFHESCEKRGLPRTPSHTIGKRLCDTRKSILQAINEMILDFNDLMTPVAWKVLNGEIDKNDSLLKELNRRIREFTAFSKSVARGVRKNKISGRIVKKIASKIAELKSFATPLLEDVEDKPLEVSVMVDDDTIYNVPETTIPIAVKAIPNILSNVPTDIDVHLHNYAEVINFCLNFDEELSIFPHEKLISSKDPPVIMLHSAQ